MGQECLAELMAVEPVVSSSIVTSDDDVAFIKTDVAADGGKTIPEFNSINETISSDVEDGKGILDVEVSFACKVDFSCFEFGFQIALFLQRMDELVFFKKSEKRFPAWADSWEWIQWINSWWW